MVFSNLRSNCTFDFGRILVSGARVTARVCTDTNLVKLSHKGIVFPRRDDVGLDDQRAGRKVQAGGAGHVQHRREAAPPPARPPRRAVTTRARKPPPRRVGQGSAHAAAVPARSRGGEGRALSAVW